MDIKEPQEKLRGVSYNDSSYDELLDSLKNTHSSGTYHLCLFLGLYSPNKQKALEDFRKATGSDADIIDFNDIVSKSEEETFQKLDEVFAKHKDTDHILYFKNGDKLCGAYTGFTHSKVKYATPQERYFLKKVQEHHGIIIVDISEFTAADKTIRRAARSIVSFVLPPSRLRRFFWHLKNYSLHGFQLKSKRPESYGEFSGNV